MTPGDFLRAIWPAKGIYCLATSFVLPDGPHKGETRYAHKTFDKISDAEKFVLERRLTGDIYFCVHTLKEHSVWNPEKHNYKTGELGAAEIRVQRNMKTARAFFFDLDVGDRVDKFATQAEAAADLKRFCVTTGLPKPLIVKSGSGLHVYWIVTELLKSNEWRTHATKLKQLARHYGFKADPMRTTDTSSVLRPAGTKNFKNRAAPTQVEAITEMTEIGTGVFIRLLDKAIIEAGIEIKAPPKLDAVADILGSNITHEFNGPSVSVRALLRSCGQMQRLALAKGNYSEPEWYNGVIGIGRFLEDGHRRVQQMSVGHPGYTPEATAEKIRQHENYRDADTGKPLGPTSCAKLLDACGVIYEDICTACPFAGKVHGPLSAARYNDPAPAPVVEELIEGTPNSVVIQIPDPPKPFMRLKGGGIAVKAKNADGDEAHTMIYDYDLYPLRRLSNVSHGLEQQVWHVVLPRAEAKDFTLDADMLYDTHKFVAAIANQGIYPNKGHVPHLQEYMVAYISLLQKTVNADAQCNHLGWSDNFDNFILPDKILSVDGSVRPAQLSLGAQRSSADVCKGGTADTQIKLLDFYNRREYRPNQFLILAGLGTPIFYMTGHHGVIINASGDVGASKSTTLYAAASHWGQPELYPINGTNNGATIKGRNERVTVLANLPVCVDEITHMPIKDAIDLAMSITQPGPRIRLETTGVERASLGSYKSTIMLTTANNSLHGMLSTNNAAGTAGSMRVFEIRFVKTYVHTKRQADDFLRLLKKNFGHLGEIFVTYVVAHRDEVEARVCEVMAEVDNDLNIQASERFWSGSIAEVLVTCEIANKLKILGFNREELKQWIYEDQVPHMRGVVKDEYSDPLGVLTDYLEIITGNILVMEKTKLAGSNLTNVQRRPVGALFAHFDTDDRMLYVLKRGFKDYCTRIGANSLQILDDLHAIRGDGRIIASKNTRRTLGAGTEFAKAQSWCFTINMTHKEITGAIDLKVMDGAPALESGANGATPTLQLVQ